MERRQGRQRTPRSSKSTPRTPRTPRAASVQGTPRGKDKEQEKQKEKEQQGGLAPPAPESAELDDELLQAISHLGSLLDELKAENDAVVRHAHNLRAILDDTDFNLSRAELNDDGQDGEGGGGEGEGEGGEEGEEEGEAGLGKGKAGK